MFIRRIGLGVMCVGLLAGGCGPQESVQTSSKIIALSGDSDRYIVQFNKPGGAAVVKAQNGKVMRDLKHLNAVAAKLPPQAIAALANSPAVDYIEPDPVRRPLAQQIPYGIKMVQGGIADPEDMSTFIQYGGTDRGNRVVCIIDTGYDLGHSDLPTSNITFTDQTSSPGGAMTDGYGHGTHVAGTIMGLNNALGVVGVDGGGNFDLHVVKIFNDAGDWTNASDLIAGLQSCMDNGANVVNMSLGGTKKSKTEEKAFNNAYDAGVLSIAAASNDGEEDGDPLNIDPYSYPASYNSVVSVAALDENKAIAGFSNKNDQVELAAPGVGVLSTLPRGLGMDVALTVDDVAYPAAGMDGSPLGSAAGALIDCKLGEAPCEGATGKVCLIARGNIAFSDKVLNCQAGGGVAAVVYNNEPGMLYGTLGGVPTTIPSVGISQADGVILLTKLGTTTTLSITASDYAAWDGTSMATPHVVGVAALIWSHNPAWTAEQIRAAMVAGAEDIGASGRDVFSGYGLVRIKEALDYLLDIPEPPEPPVCSDEICDDGLDNDCDGQIDDADTDCQSGSCFASDLTCAADSDCCSNVCVMRNKKRGKCQ